MVSPALFSLLVAIHLTVCLGADSYIAAVVEYATPRTPSASPDQVLLSNSAAYVEFMTNASLSKVDIIVFPENGLHGRGNPYKFIAVPSPSDNVAPCDFNSSYHPGLVMISCAARTSKLYTVINLHEEFFNITSNATEHYNTNVAFDRNGTVVGRYRKFNPYGEAVKKPIIPDHHYFQTDFGVDFGMFTCFDIEFLEPGITMARELGIRHFIFPNCWISELPFLTAIQMGWGWAYSLDVVLLAAGCNDPLQGGTGTAIYQGRQGALQYFQTNANTSRMLIANVSNSLNHSVRTSNLKYPSDASYHEYSNSQAKGTSRMAKDKRLGESNTSLFLLKDYLDVYTTRSFQDLGSCPDTSGPAHPGSPVYTSLTAESTLCQNNFCCDFQVQMSTTFSQTPLSEPNRGDDFTRYFYRMVVFDGVRWYGGGIATGGVQVCGIVSCVNDSISSCGLRADDHFRQENTCTNPTYGDLYQSGTVFESISITPKFHYNSTFIFPDILVTGSGDGFGALMPSSEFTFEKFEPKNESLVCSLKIESHVPNLITAAVYARQFDRDGQPRTDISSYAYPHSNSIFVVCILFLLIFHHIL